MREVVVDAVGECIGPMVYSKVGYAYKYSRGTYISTVHQ
jgi:hypothetical protein